ncbi:MAG: DUF5117 domain-containing protein, partial [Candidatus Eiseniibacteriota bacterium]
MQIETPRHPSVRRLTVAATTGLVLLLATFAVTAAQQPPAGEAEEALPSIAETVAGKERIDGLYTLYRDKNELLAMVRAEQLDTEFIMATSVARGRFFFGFQWSEQLLLWRRNDRSLMLVQPDVWHRAAAKSPIADAVERTYTETVVRTLPIRAEDDKGNVLIDLSALYLKNPQAFFGDLVKNADAALARINKVKNFPQNIEVAADLYTTDKRTGYASLMTV